MTIAERIDSLFSSGSGSTVSVVMVVFSAGRTMIVGPLVSYG
ncbi:MULTISPECIES: hypothetical protein [Dietzia]|nr:MULTISPECIES: hypothetical protein [Dietzia]